MLKVAVLDMQPIDPPIGGGRLRLLGLYHNLGEGIDCRYVGTYDWPGESYRRHELSYCLEEIDVPLTDEHHAAADKLGHQANGKTVIDVTFGRLGTMSPEYVNTASEIVRWADAVVFSHPWVYPLVADQLSPNQVVVYDSHNVEGFLRAQIFEEDDGTEERILKNAVEDEYALALRADLTLACSQEDLKRFSRVYGLSTEKIRVIPNGVMVSFHPVPTPDEKRKLKGKLGISGWDLVAIFIGSPYGPNLDAGRFITGELAQALPNVLFVIAGGVGAEINTSNNNVHITGRVTEEEKHGWLGAADLAVNPMFSGSGTNIKMFDFMAMGLPSVTTEVGARGIVTAGRDALLLVPPRCNAFVEAIQRLSDTSRRAEMSEEARACVEEGYAWERISPLMGQMLASRAGRSTPMFSVLVPSYERHDQLDALIYQLEQQTERDFELVVVDQSAHRWPGADRSYTFPMVYFHSQVKGAVRARNTAATLAQGSILAFTDDDCLPEQSWLLRAREYFCDPNVVGVEGLIYSDHHDDLDWRPVTNLGFEGIGFMTANLFVRSDCFQWLGGFDLEFDRPHFREDTDLGWRLQGIGTVPYGSDVPVFHPAQPRRDDRESAQERAKFFEKDALLYRKHPARYRQLFESERHFAHTPGFAENLIGGFKKYGVSLPCWIEDFISLRERSNAQPMQEERVDGELR